MASLRRQDIRLPRRLDKHVPDIIRQSFSFQLEHAHLHRRDMLVRTAEVIRPLFRQPFGSAHHITYRPARADTLPDEHQAECVSHPFESGERIKKVKAHIPQPGAAS